MKNILNQTFTLKEIFSGKTQMQQGSEIQNKNKYVIETELKKKAKERVEKEKKRISDIELSDNEIKEILKGIQSKSYNMMGNLDKIKKLQQMRLVRAATGVEIQSSFSKPFYLTKKGEDFIK